MREIATAITFAIVKRAIDIEGAMKEGSKKFDSTKIILLFGYWI